MKTFTILILALIISVPVFALDKTEANKNLLSFSTALNEVELAANESRVEFKWFTTFGDTARDFVKDAYNDSKVLPIRKSALFLYAKCWPTKAEGRLRNAETGDEPALREFARKLRQYLNGTYKAPVIATPVPIVPADPLGDRVAAWVKSPKGAEEAGEALKALEKKPKELFPLLEAVKRRGTLQLLPAIAWTLDSTDEKIAKAGLDVFAAHAKELEPDLRNPQACYVWWVTSGSARVKSSIQAAK